MDRGITSGWLPPVRTTRACWLPASLVRALWQRRHEWREKQHAINQTTGFLGPRIHAATSTLAGPRADTKKNTIDAGNLPAE